MPDGPRIPVGHAREGSGDMKWYLISQQLLEDIESTLGCGCCEDYDGRKKIIASLEEILVDE